MFSSIMSSRIAVASIVVLMLGTTTIEGGIGSASALGNGCPDGVSAYTLSAADINACGFTEIPLSAVTTLPDGGNNYTYEMAGGASATIVVPPANFNPVSASDSELAIYGIPVRPTSSAALEVWLNKYSRIDYPTPPSELNQTPIQASTVPRSYAGWFSGTTSNTATDLYFTQPNASLSQCTGGSGISLGAIWAGLGAGTSNLAQDGTYFGSDFPGVTNGEFFFEFWPDNVDQNSSGTVNLTTTASAGDSVESQIAYDGGLVYNVNINDWTSGKAYDVLMTAPSNFHPNGSTAEAIVESPEVDILGDTSDLPYFTRIAIDSAEVRVGGSYESMANSGDTYFNMKDAAGLFQATPTQIQSNGSFYVNYQTCK